MYTWTIKLGGGESWMEYGDYLATKKFYIPDEEWTGFNNRIKYADYKETEFDRVFSYIKFLNHFQLEIFKLL
jgi:hypothetical protein